MAKFNQSDVTRLVKGVEAAGKPVSRVEVKPDGGIILHTGEEDTNSADAAFDEWEKRSGAGSS